jgi:TolB-like protein/Flp pilus assembly protein TadD/predicted Ser/Thr protein kinase
VRVSEGAGDGGSRATGVEPGALTALLQEVAAAPEKREAEPLSLPPGTILGRFEIIRELGRGGFGVVYEAKDRDLGRQVAVKVVRPGRIREEEGKVSREAEAIARLAHPNLITLHEVGRSGHGPFLVFELLRGKTLDLRIEEGPLPVQEAVHIAMEIARGLAHAHAEGVIHRDLKPANVFVTSKGQVKILDFGMAHAFGRRRLSGGTPAYMAPEQWEDDPEDERTDVFALGVMLYRTLSGEYPFPEGQGRWSAEPSVPRKLDVPGAPELAELVEKMLDRTPKGRPRDGAAVLAVLAPIEEKLRARPADGKPPEHAKRRKATFGDLLAELKRRHVFRVMVGYGIFAFAVLQVTEPIMHGADLPNWVLKAVLVALVLGFPVAVILAWVFDLTAQGVKRTASASGPGVPTFGRARYLLPLAVSAAVLAIVAAGAGAWYAWKRTTQHRPAPVAGDSPSIAVLPFKDLSPEHDQEYFSDGMTEEILTALSKVKGLRVPGRVSSFYFKGKNVDPGEIAQKLGVVHLLEGSVRRSGSKLRISAEVVRASDGERIWSQTFNRDLTDVFAIQDEISRDVVEALRVKLVPGQQALAKEHRTASPEAYQSYLLGTHFAQSFSGDSQKRAIAALERAVEIDPGFAPSWARLTRAKIVAGTLGVIPWADARRDALAAANRAVELAPDLPEAIAARAHARLAEWDWTGVQVDVDRLRERWADDPASIRAMANHAFWTGRIPEAVDLFRRFLDKEPLEGTVWNGLGVALWWAARYDEADRAFARALEVDPRNDFAVGNRGKALVDAGRPGDALALCQKAGPGDRGRLECEALAHHALGNAARSQEALDVMLAKPQGDWIFLISRVHACRGEKDLAFEWLERARVAHVRSMNGLMGDPCFLGFRGDPRWAAMLRGMNDLPDLRAAGSAAGPGAAAAAPTPSIAVLPFADMSPKHDQEYFADGVAEEILNALTQVRGLKVIGRVSSFAFKGRPDDLRTIGEKLGVANVLEGSIRKDGSRVRVTVKLVRVAEGSQAWSEAYDRKLTGIFKVQEEIARAVVGALKVKLLPGATAPVQGTTTIWEAHQHFLRGRDLTRATSTDNLKAAAGEYEKAVALDPSFALAWAGLAHTYRTLEAVDTANQSATRRERALFAADRAIVLAPNLSDGYVARGRIRRGLQFDWPRAHDDFQRAFELAPGDARAAAYSGADWLAMGDTSLAVPLNKRAIDLDPLWPQGWNLLGVARLHAGEMESAREALSRAMELAPGFDEPRLNLCGALLAERKPQQALTVGEGTENPWVRHTCTAMAHHSLGHPRESRAALDALVTTRGKSEQYSIATVHAWRGETDQAFEWLEKALTSPAPGMDLVKINPALRSLHSDPRWKPFLRKLKLPVD